MRCEEFRNLVDRYLDELEAAMLVEYAEGRVATSPFLEWPPPSADAPRM